MIDPMFPSGHAELTRMIEDAFGPIEQLDIDNRELVQFLLDTELPPSVTLIALHAGLMRLVRDLRANAVRRAGSKLSAVTSDLGTRSLDQRQMTLADLDGWIETAERDVVGRQFEIEVAKAIRSEMIASGLLLVGDIGNDRLAEIRIEITERWAS